MVEGKKRKKLKKLVKKETKLSQKSTQITKVNIKIGDVKKKAKRKRKKRAGGGGGGPPARLVRRPHLPPNPLIGAINYTPPPGYLTPSDIRNLYAQPPQPVPAQVAGFQAAVPALPQAQGQVIGQAQVAQGQLVEGQPVAVQARPSVVQPQSRGRVNLVARVSGFGNSPAISRQSSFPRPQNTSAIYGPRSAGTGLGGLLPVDSDESKERDGPGQGMSGINTGATGFIGGGLLPQGSSISGNGGTHRAEVAHLHMDAAGSPGGAGRLFQPNAMTTRNLRGRAIAGMPSGGRRGGSGGAAASGGAVPVARGLRARLDRATGGPARRRKKAVREGLRRQAEQDASYQQGSPIGFGDMGGSASVFNVPALDLDGTGSGGDY